MKSRFISFLKELRRRKVYRVAVAYLVVGFGVASGAQYVFEMLGFSAVPSQFVAVLIILGFPVSLVLAWAYELRPDGPPSESGDERESGLPQGVVVPAGRSEPTVGMEDSRPAIAVLPFDDFSPDASDAYFANGMHEEVLTQIQKVKGLAVRGRTSVLKYRDNPKTIREIAEELGVRFLLEGSARKVGDEVRLTAQLIDADKDEHVWAENYDRPLTVENLFSVQSDIAQQVAQAVGIMVSAEEQTRIDRQPTHDLRAYDYYLTGRHHLRQWSLRDVEEGLRFLEKSVETDPSFAQGYAGVAWAYSVLAAWGQPPEDTWPHARAAAERALSMDESQAEAHTALALEALSHRYDWNGSEVGFKRALEFNPSNVDALDWLGCSLAGIWGRQEEGKAYSHRANQADPHSLSVQYHSALLHIWTGEYQYAQRTLDELGNSDSALFMRRHAGAYIAMAQDRYEDALEAMKSALEIADQRVEIFTGMLGYLYGRLGCDSEARAQLEALDDLERNGVYVSPVSRAHIHAGLGEKDEAIGRLELAHRTGNHWMIWLGNIPWEFKELQSEPRFQSLLQRMDFPRLRRAQRGLESGKR